MNTPIGHSHSLPRPGWFVGLLRRFGEGLLGRQAHRRPHPEATRIGASSSGSGTGPAGANGGGGPATGRAASDDWLERELPRLYFELPFVGMAISSASSRRLLRVNGEFCRMMGYTREELESRSWPEITHPDDLDANVQQFAALLAGEIEGYRLRKRYVRADGSLLHAELEVRCVQSPDGSARYTLATVNDVTERRVAEMRLT
ncbi:MAG: PAS domain S-box protein, partial [Gemmatimonadetes bacterium]|nr:PAS domain S-box protein [Gemmatimonadota bacterium]